MTVKRNFSFRGQHKNFSSEKLAGRRGLEAGALCVIQPLLFGNGHHKKSVSQLTICDVSSPFWRVTRSLPWSGKLPELPIQCLFRANNLVKSHY